MGLLFYYLLVLGVFHRVQTDVDLRSIETNRESIEENINPFLDQELEDERHEFYLRHPFGHHQPPMFKPEDLVGQDPEELIKSTKRGRSMMVFATVSGNPTRRETEEITYRWSLALKNAMYDVTK